LASAWLPVSFMDLFVSIVQIVLVPVILGLVVRYLAGDSIEKGIAVLPLVSVVGIVGVVAAVVSANTEAIVQSGLLIFLVVILHNMLGYIIGLLAARVFGLRLADQKATSIEVGMQNSGLAAALSAAHFSPLSAVPPALFSVWHNIPGSLLATWMSKKTDGSERAEVPQEKKRVEDLEKKGMKVNEGGSQVCLRREKKKMFDAPKARSTRKPMLSAEPGDAPGGRID